MADPAKRQHPLKKIAKAIAGLLVLILGLAGVFAARASFVDYPLIEGKTEQLHGAFHVHTTLSDGRATPEHIGRIAAGAGLSFVILSDHNLDKVIPPKRESGVLLVYATELSTPSGHLVAAGLSTPLDKQTRETRAMAAATEQGALTVISHPIQKKRPWTDWEAAKSATGIELYSADSMFRDAQRSPFSIFLPAMGSYLSEPMQAFMIVSNRQEEGTKKLLELSSSRAPLLALCAADAHGMPPYIHEFRALSLVLPKSAALSEDPVAAQTELLAILRGGEAYCAFHGLAPSDGFSISGVGEGRAVTVGAKLEVQLPSKLPPGARVEVAGSGKLLEDGKTVEATTPGALLVEVWVDVPARLFGTMRRPWIVASPIRVLPASP